MHTVCCASEIQSDSKQKGTKLHQRCNIGGMHPVYSHGNREHNVGQLHPSSWGTIFLEHLKREKSFNYCDISLWYIISPALQYHSIQNVNMTKNSIHVSTKALHCVYTVGITFLIHWKWGGLRCIKSVLSLVTMRQQTLILQDHISFLYNWCLLKLPGFQIPNQNDFLHFLSDDFVSWLLL